MIREGDFYEETFTFSQEDVNAFIQISNDSNPIHYDREYSAKTIFKRPIIHGFLAGSVFSKIIGTQFPGEGSIYLKQNMSFKKPMYVDEKYKAIIKIIEINRAKHRANISTVVYNGREELVISGEALVMNKTKL